MVDVRRSILIVDNDDVFRANLARLLKAEPSVGTIGHATTATEALAIVRHVAFDALFVDVALPDQSGLDVARRIRELRPKTSVVLVSANRDTTSHTTARALGAGAFLLKEDAAQQLPDVVRRLLSGTEGHEAARLT